MVLAAVAMASVIEAHKPITSPFTYSADVLPILREQCGRCHAPGGVAPMSLLTYEEAVPWGESMRLELSTGHMPPWTVEAGAARLTHPAALTARELNVLLTWAAGGTPAGDVIRIPEPAPVSPRWALGTPDAVIDLPARTLGPSEQERVETFTVPVPPGGRALRAVDLLPATPAMVRSARIELHDQAPAGSLAEERLLGLWVPGDAAETLTGAAFHVPADASLQVRVQYRRTWSYEGKPLTDASRVGLYFASPTAPAVRATIISPPRPVTLPRAMRAVAVYAASAGSVSITATRPGRRREVLLAFRARTEWARRFWFREPIALPRGTTLTVRLIPDPPSLFPKDVTAAAAATARPPAPGRVGVDLIP
jgi:hypothetical protein